VSISYADWLAFQAQRVQQAGGTAPLYPQPTTTAQQVTPGFGIAAPTDVAQPAPAPTNYGITPLTQVQFAALTPEQQQAYRAQVSAARLQQAQQGGQTPSSPTGFGLPPAGWAQSPAANQQYAQYGQLGAAAGQQGGQYGYLGGTNSQLPAGTAAGAWSSSPQPSARGIAAPARIKGVTPPAAPQAQQRAAAPSAVAQAATGPALGPTGTGTAPQTLQAYGAALPTPNKIVARNFMKLDPDTQDFLRSGYRATGYSDNQINQAVKQGLPQFGTPGRSGTVR
jgi:hypothetical protein